MYVPTLYALNLQAILGGIKLSPYAHKKPLHTNAITDTPWKHESQQLHLAALTDCATTAQKPV